MWCEHRRGLLAGRIVGDQRQRVRGVRKGSEEKRIIKYVPKMVS